MKTVIINGRFLTQPLTGVQRYAAEIVLGIDRMLQSGAIDESEHAVRLVAPARRVRDLPLKRLPVEAWGRLGGQAWEQLELPRRTRGATLVCLGNSAPLAQVGARNRLVLTIHDLSYRYFKENYSLAYRTVHHTIGNWLLPRADAVITVSRAERSRILEHFPGLAGSLHVVHHGCDHGGPAACPSAVAGLPADLPDRPYVLFVGSLNRIKNLSGLLAAWPEVRRRHDVDLVVVGGQAAVFAGGDGAAADRAEEGVRYLGQVDDPAVLAEVYRRAILLAFPSLSESFGLPCLEAMRAGCPVVASDIPALREVCGDAAVWIDPADPAGIAAAIDTVLADEAARSALRHKGLARAEAFRWDEAVRRTWSIVAAVAAGRRPVPESPSAG